MASLRLFLQLTLAALTFNLVYGAVNEVPLPPIDLNEWWGPANATREENTSINKYTIRFKESMIAELKHRLQYHRQFTSALEGVALEYGFHSKTLLRWVKHLVEEYPFKQREVFLNQFPQYTTKIQGLLLHYIRVKCKNVKNKVVIPLVIFHGWPGSVREFYETIPYLISYGEAQGFALDIIVPSLPGFGFSDGAARPGLGADKMAVVFRNLMQRLGYKKYYVQGGDVGAVVGSNMATFFSNEVLGYHTNFPFLYTPEIVFQLVLGSFHPEEIVKPKVENRIYPLRTYIPDLIESLGYMHIQATKPDTVGFGLADSPAGLLAYTFERIATLLRKKFINYTDGGLTEVLTAEQLLDNFMIYWSTNTVTTSMRVYAETLNKRYFGLRIHEIRTPVPMWLLQTPDEVSYVPPQLLKKKFPNLLHETLPSEGGHFYAWEQPKLFAEDVIESIVAFREWHALNSTLYSKCSLYIEN